jgi:hypothetical protein
LEYDFMVAPGADPKQISLGLTGATPSLDSEGNVLLRLADGRSGSEEADRLCGWCFRYTNSSTRR